MFILEESCSSRADWTRPSGSLIRRLPPLQTGPRPTTVWAWRISERAVGIPTQIAEFRKALTLRPSFAEAHNNLGVAFAEQGHLDDAANELRAALRLKPDLADACYNLGLIDLIQSDARGAARELRKAAKLQPENPKFHYRLGLALARVGDADGATQEMRTAMQLDPTDPTVHYNLGRLLSRRGDQKAAAEEFAIYARMQESVKAAQTQNTQAAVEIGKGLKALAAGDAQQAIEAFKRAVQAAPQSA